MFERPIDLITVGNPANVNLKREVGSTYIAVGSNLKEMDYFYVAG